MSQEQSVRIMCPSLTCRRILAVPVSSRGKNVRCKNCGAMIRVPDRQAAAVAAPAPSAEKPGEDGAPAKSKPAA